MQLSPWWLLLLVPLVASLGYLLYRAQLKGIPRWSAVSLVVVRAVILGGLVFLAFRPSAVLRKILTSPGRIIFVLDNSESMATKDSGMTDEDALRLARELAPKEREQGERYHQLAEVLSGLEDRIRKFEAFQRGMDRGGDAFWDEAEKAQTAALESFEDFAKLAGSVPRIDEESQRRFGAVLAEVAQQKTGLSAFFRGDHSPDKQAFDLYCTRLTSLRRWLLELQAALDRLAISGGNEVLKAEANAMRGRERLDLLGEKLEGAKAALQGLAPGQFLRSAMLMNGDQSPLDLLPPADLKSQRGVTDIIGRLDRLAGAESDFPLTAFVLFSDGRDLGGKSLATLEQSLSRKQAPVYAAALGSVNEPLDLAILDVVAPPFAVKGLPIRVSARVKAVLKEPVPVQAEVLSQGRPVVSEKVTLGERETERVELSFTPTESGLFRFKLRFGTAPGEAFPIKNNAVDFAVHVRDEKVKVLFLDWKPRWETRFALNIFQRMEFIELNSIIAVVQENAIVKRGAGRGAWPANRAALEMYDLIVLGDVPDDLLTPAEWEDLKTVVLEKGKAVCFIGSGRRDPVPQALVPALLPLGPRSGEGDAAVELDELAELAITDTGAFHPITYLLASGLARVDEKEPLVVPPSGGSGGPAKVAPEPVARVLPDTQVLLTEKRTGQPVVCCRFADQGRAMLIDSESLWRLLNPTMLSSHAEMYVGLVAWAIESGFGEGSAEKQEAPRLGLDRRTLTVGSRVQVWIEGAPAGAVVEAVAQDGSVLAESEATRPRSNSALARAAFESLEPQDVVFRLKGTEVTSEYTVVVEDYPELKHLSLNEGFLKRLTSATGGELRAFTEFEKLFLQMQPKERVETDERIWRLWDAWTVLAFLVFLLTLEWVWRKLVGLV